MPRRKTSAHLLWVHGLYLSRAGEGAAAARATAPAAAGGGIIICVCIVWLDALAAAPGHTSAGTQQDRERDTRQTVKVGANRAETERVCQAWASQRATAPMANMQHIHWALGVALTPLFCGSLHQAPGSLHATGPGGKQQGVQRKLLAAGWHITWLQTPSSP